MLWATKTSLWTSNYRIATEDRVLATWNKSWWKSGGAFELDGLRFAVQANMWGNKYGLIGADRTTIASADRVGRRQWTVAADGRTFEFRRASLWRREQELHSDGLRVGSVKRTSLWRSDVVADLPGLSLPIQIFALVVVITMWEAADAAAGAVAGGSVAGSG